MKTYHIRFEGELGERVQSYRAASPGQAFKKCLRQFPGARLIEGWSGIGSHYYGCVTYQPPSTAGVVAEPARQEEETKFPFYDEVKGRRRPFS